MGDREERLVEYERLNLLGKIAFLGGGTVRLLGNAIESVIDRATDLVVEVERSFKEGLDPNIEEAKILDEYRDESPSP